ncbi:MAG: phosphoribosylamine--glycine ligase [Bacteroidales bacterium]
MNILLIGSGGREHALAWKISQSKRCSNLYIAPGNAGTALCGKNIPIAGDNFAALGDFVIENKVELVVVGPEDPLVKGIHDYFLGKPALNSVPVIGPSRSGALLEGSKDFAKQFMIRHNIPTAAYASFTAATLQDGFRFLTSLKPPYVLKADGLAAGKGVLILHSLKEAKEELEMMLSGKFGNASKTVVIEEFLQGIELSAFVLTDGKSYKILPEAKDYKRIGEADTGPNTGGMGSVSPVPFATPDFLKKVEDRIIYPTVEGLKNDGIPYTGFIFFGLIKVGEDPWVIEYNVRLGDPETESIMPRIVSDFVELLEAAGKGELHKMNLEIDPRPVASVMMVSGGYPGDYAKGFEIQGLEQVSGSQVFHAGTRMENGKVLTNGGRVLTLTSYGNTQAEALQQCYENAGRVSFKDSYFRRDIGFDL